MPGWLLPLLLTGASTAANAVGARKADSAIAGTQLAERMRQRQFDDESFAINQAAQARYDDMAGKTDAKATELTNLFNTATEQAPMEPVGAMPVSDSNIIVSRENAAMDAAKGRTDRRASAMGNLRAFGDLLGEASLGQGRDASQLGLIGSMRRGSMSVLPMELEAAAQKSRGWGLLGDILGAGAGLATNFAIFGSADKAKSIFGGDK